VPIFRKIHGLGKSGDPTKYIQSALRRSYIQRATRLLAKTPVRWRFRRRFWRDQFDPSRPYVPVHEQSFAQSPEGIWNTTLLGTSTYVVNLPNRPHEKHFIHVHPRDIAKPSYGDLSIFVDEVSRGVTKSWGIHTSDAHKANERLSMNGMNLVEDWYERADRGERIRRFERWQMAKKVASHAGRGIKISGSVVIRPTELLLGMPMKKRAELMRDLEEANERLRKQTKLAMRTLKSAGRKGTVEAIMNPGLRKKMLRGEAESKKALDMSSEIEKELGTKWGKFYEIEYKPAKGYEYDPTHNRFQRIKSSR